MDINMDLLQWFINFLVKPLGDAFTCADKYAVKSEIIPNQQLV